MFVNRYTFKDNLTGDSSYNITIPVSSNNGMLGQWDVVNRDLVNVEVANAVNTTFDYEKVKLLPKVNNNLIKEIIYKINILNADKEYNNSTKWGDIGFIDDDLKFKKNSFTKSFLRLDFYDSDIATNQNLISFITLFPKFSYQDVSSGKIPQATNYPLKFTLGNPLIDRKLNGEGFSLYHFKDEIIPTINKYLYMKATFNNAKTGKSMRLMVNNNPNLEVDKLLESTIVDTIKHEIKADKINGNNTYVRYILTRDIDGYYYRIDEEYSSGESMYDSSNNSYTINLNEISAK